MQPKTLNALKWIVGIFDKHNVVYRIGGGFAAHIYGSNRPINDIDVSMSGKFFPAILSDIAPYITHPLSHYSNSKWDCDTLCIDYHGQQIDITDIDTLKMSSKDKTEWFQTKDFYRKFDTIKTHIDGISVSLIDPRDLVAYKKHLDGDHQLVDIAAVEKYIKQHNL